MSAVDTRVELAWLIHRACGCNDECPPDGEDFAAADAIVAAGFSRPAVGADFATRLAINGLAQARASMFLDSLPDEGGDIDEIVRTSRREAYEEVMGAPPCPATPCGLPSGHDGLHQRGVEEWASDA